MSAFSLQHMREYVFGLHDALRTWFEDQSGCHFRIDEWTRSDSVVGRGKTAVLEGDQVFEKVGLAWSDIAGTKLPPAATARNPALVNRPFHVVGISLIAHPVNPFVPTVHMNVRAFQTDDESVWWFGGGFDLTPVYADLADVIHWHQNAKAACDPIGAHVYPHLKKNCDEYFYLKHRQETRGVGGLFVDDLNEHTPVLGMSATACFSLIRNMGDALLPGYAPIVERHRDKPFTAAQRSFQAFRRSRYVEFNLVFDRGTLFGLQGGGRTESVLMSMPPHAEWRYDFEAPVGSPEAAIGEFLKARAWL
jgi:coproporphyrinogen III oxidase